jgi:hypothetical protein
MNAQEYTAPKNATTDDIIAIKTDIPSISRTILTGMVYPEGRVTPVDPPPMTYTRIPASNTCILNNPTRNNVTPNTPITNKFLSLSCILLIKGVANPANNGIPIIKAGR